MRDERGRIRMLGDGGLESLVVEAVHAEDVLELIAGLHVDGLTRGGDLRGNVRGASHRESRDL